MSGLGRVVALGGCVLAVTVLAGCSSGTKRTVERTSVQPTAYAATASGVVPGESAALSMAGRWYLNDEFERDCYVNLSAEAIDAVRRVARASGECSGLMTHVGGWAAYDGQSALRLYDKTGRVIGQLSLGDPRTYKGTLNLTTGEAVSATLRQI